MLAAVEVSNAREWIFVRVVAASFAFIVYLAKQLNERKFCGEEIFCENFSLPIRNFILFKFELQFYCESSLNMWLDKQRRDLRLSCSYGRTLNHTFKS